ncbi:MAG: hypothetical protein EPO11_09400 [Gammaproteobacteria bacterium]|nr:MAG: hypothetical protein EPO11_09400 [Gammaproteobacteria bacterium]
MLKTFIYRGLCFLLCLTAMPCYAQQTIQIYTRFQSFKGKPSLLLILRDVDHNQNIPYLFDVTRGDDFWLALSFSDRYLVQASTLKIRVYQPRSNTYKSYTIRDFCHLESRGQILRGESLYVTIDGDLTPNADTYTCHVSRYTDTNFVVAKPE